MTDKQKIQQLEEELKQTKIQNVYMKEETLFKQMVDLQKQAESLGIELRVLKFNKPKPKDKK